uniref:Sugar transporter SWEET1 n=1 Tax=Hemiselmis tepida TaxID=464990 RepID=A0A7S0VVN7_9CRYP
MAAAYNATATELFIMNVAAPTIGSLFSSALALGPMSAVLEARGKVELGDVNPDVFPVLMVNCIAWSIYSAIQSNAYIFSGNIPGVICGLFYTLSTYGLSAGPTRLKIEKLTLALATALILTCFATVTVWKAQQAAVLGLFSNALVFAVFSSPLTTLAEVLRTRNSVSINRPFGIIQVLNCFTWVAYSVYIHDMYLIIPNVFGLALGVVQCALMVVFPAKPLLKLSSSDPNLLANDVLSDYAERTPEPPQEP